MKNSWFFPILQAIHVAGLVMSVGMIALLDFTALGVVRKGPSAAELAAWTRAGIAIMLTTGSLLFLADRGRYLHNPAFRMKVALLALALLAHFTIRRKAASRGPALLSLALWAAVVLAARAIADFDD